MIGAATHEIPSSLGARHSDNGRVVPKANSIGADVPPFDASKRYFPPALARPNPLEIE